MPRHLFFSLTIFACVLTIGSGGARAASVEDLIKGAVDAVTNSEDLSTDVIVKGLKDALKEGTKKTVEQLHKDGGYSMNPDLRILMPDKMKKVTDTMRTIGLGSQVDSIIVKMNQAAERAAGEAIPVFTDAIVDMSIEDARKILNGDNKYAATEYFYGKTVDQLRSTYKPLVENKLSEVGVLKEYLSLVDKYKKIPFVPDMKEFDLVDHVTEKALGGLFVTVGKWEAAFRENPEARTTDLIKTVFGTLDSN